MQRKWTWAHTSFVVVIGIISFLLVRNMGGSIPSRQVFISSTQIPSTINTHVSGEVIVATENHFYYRVDLQTGEAVELIKDDLYYNEGQQKEVFSPYGNRYVAVFHQQRSGSYAIEVYTTGKNGSHVGGFSGSATIDSDTMRPYVTYRWLDDSHLVIADSTMTLYVVTVSSTGVSEPQTVLVLIPEVSGLRIVAP